MDFQCRFDGRQICCTLTADRALSAPLLVLNFIGPTQVISGGKVESRTGGQIELRLPDLRPGVPVDMVFAAAGRDRPVNRAFLPLGAWLRLQDGPLMLPLPPAGVIGDPFPDAPDFDGLRMVPQPMDWRPAGDSIALSALSSDDPAFRTAAELSARTGGPAILSPDGLPVTCRTADLPEEGYRLTIAHSGITVEAATPAGRFYAAVTLATLLRTHSNLPCGVIEDRPRFAWRGQLLDCARHFFAVDTILSLLDLMALLKLNRFHWHFADDEAFRLQIDSLPALWQQTEMRGDGQLVPALFSSQPLAGGSYSKADVARILSHAAALNIEVLPEIEVPAHAYALARVFPQTRDPKDTGGEASVQGYSGNAMNPAMPATWDLLEDLVREIGGMFPFAHLHLGCDELPDETWMGSPAARALMAQEGLKTTKDLQGWTIARLAAFAAGQGLRPAAWEEAAQGCQGGIGNGAILFSWTGQGPGLDAARRGHDVVMCPGQHAYLDMAQSDDPDDWGANWAATISLADTVAWDPVPADEPELAARILGVQSCFWGEFTTHDTQLWPMLMPRLLGLASKGWQFGPVAGDDLARLSAAYRDLAEPTG